MSLDVVGEEYFFFELHNVIDDEIHVAGIGKDLVSLLTNQVPRENSLDELKQHVWDFQDTRLKLWDVLDAKFTAMPAMPMAVNSTTAAPARDTETVGVDFDCSVDASAAGILAGKAKVEH